MKLRWPRRALMAALVAGTAGCATQQSAQLGAQYLDPEAPAEALRGASILVVCDAPEEALKLICENQFSTQLAALGTRPVTNASLVSPTPGREAPAGAYLGAAQAAGAHAVFAATLAPDYSMLSAAPTISFGIGGFGGSGGYRGGSGVGGGVGVTLPVGQSAGPAGLSAIGSFIDVASGRVIWSSRAVTPSGADASATIAEAARVLVDAAKRAALF